MLEHAKLRSQKFVYDFAKHGGAVAAIVVGAGQIPSGAIIEGGRVYVNTAVTSDGAATVALSVEGAGDVLAATAKASLSLAAMLDVVPVRTAATAIKTTAARGLTVTPAVAALTAGKITVWLDYRMI